MKHIVFAEFALTLILSTIALPPQAFSQTPLFSTSLKDGNFQIQFEEATLKALQLRYSSRMNSRSLFGFGWCSDLDVQIQVLRGGDLELTDCDEASRFQPVKSSSLTRIIPLLFEDPTKNIIELDEKGYRLERGAEVLRFDTSGRLQERQSDKTKGLKVLTRTPELWTLQTHGQIVQLEWNIETHQIRQIRGAKKQSWNLVFHNFHLSQLGEIQFRYDPWDNLIHLQRGKQELLIDYDFDDRVVRLETSPGCQTVYDYPSLPEGPKSLPEGAILRLTARAWRNCGAGPELLSEMTSEYHRVSENNVILAAAEIGKRRFEFHPILGPRESEPLPRPRPRDLVIAIIDTGADLGLPILKKYLWSNSLEKLNSRDDDGNGLKDDLHGWNFADSSSDLRDHHGHGTHIASLIAEQLDELSLKSDSRPVRLMILKYYQADADGATNMKNSLRAFRYALEKDVDVINYSGGGRIPSSEEEDLLRQAARQGVLVVAAAGNESLNSDRSPFFPANYPFSNILSVGSVGKNLRPFPSSNFGERSVDVMAAGEAVEALLPGGRRGNMTGTSQATALANGAAAAFMRQAPGRWKPEDVISQLLLTSDSRPSLKGKNRMGGRLSAKKLIHSRSSHEIAQGPRQIRRDEQSEELFFVPQAWPSSKSSSYFSRTGLN